MMMQVIWLIMCFFLATTLVATGAWLIERFRNKELRLLCKLYEDRLEREDK